MMVVFETASGEYSENRMAPFGACSENRRTAPSPKADVFGFEHARRFAEGSPWKRVGGSSQRREMAETAVKEWA